ncbi:hypothetical protein [Actinoplanes auranticolor]|uniref:Uncharacterized protein n=1 Tax=Actinoplanes auranticolor TaxID=47988 RepID=A0A919S3E6_9ACTN|nr:hypothetical protein [Actinoplanes auranticolor]GIM63880.1 hypothetical protein Aau02nite_06920 [Actinoplanes auranticolor]
MDGLVWASTGSYPLYRFEDAGEYQYHVEVPQRLPAKPVKVSATSSLGGQSRAITPTAWPNATPPPRPTGYQKDFIDAYLTPTDIRARIQRLGRQYDDLVDVIDLPRRTQGYRRTAAAYLGDPAAAAVVVESVKFGDQAMNGVQVRTVDPGRANRPLGATYRDRVLTVSLATDAGGNDFNFQRKNLVNHCTGAARDPALRNSWGVDINRNYTVGSYFDGYVGGSPNCLRPRAGSRSPARRSTSRSTSWTAPAASSGPSPPNAAR